jgi:hypothetical protein
MKKSLRDIADRITAISNGCGTELFRVERGHGMYSLPTRRWCKKQKLWLEGKNFCEDCLRQDTQGNHDKNAK